MSKLKDLTGQRFGYLTVVKRVEDYVSPRGNHNVQWLCKCDCKEDKYITVSGGSLARGLTKSCGCLQKKQSAENGKKNKKYNTYDLSGEYGIGYTTKGEEFYFDLEDYSKIKDYCWRIDNNGYIVSYNTNHSINQSNLILLHKQIMSGEYIDHINHNKQDNRKSNLRVVTASQNNMNATKRIDNTSGVTGVSWHKGLGLWRARINVNSKEISLGCFNKFDDAVKARKDAEEKYFGEYSYDNSKSYTI